MGHTPQDRPLSQAIYTEASSPTPASSDSRLDRSVLAHKDRRQTRTRSVLDGFLNLHRDPGPDGPGALAFTNILDRLGALKKEILQAIRSIGGERDEDGDRIVPPGIFTPVWILQQVNATAHRYLRDLHRSELRPTSRQAVDELDVTFDVCAQAFARLLLVARQEKVDITAVCDSSDTLRACQEQTQRRVQDWRTWLDADKHTSRLL